MKTESGEDTLTKESFFKLIGAHPYHANANTIWDTLELHKYSITKELASLREQLKNQDATLIGLAASNSEYCKQFREVKDQLKVLEDENRELKDTLSKCHKSLCTYGEHPLIDSWVKKVLSNLSA